MNNWHKPLSQRPPTIPGFSLGGSWRDPTQKSKCPSFPLSLYIYKTRGTSKTDDDIGPIDTDRKMLFSSFLLLFVINFIRTFLFPVKYNGIKKSYQKSIFPKGNFYSPPCLLFSSLHDYNSSMKIKAKPALVKFFLSFQIFFFRGLFFIQ